MNEEESARVPFFWPNHQLEDQISLFDAVRIQKNVVCTKTKWSFGLKSTFVPNYALA